MTIIQKGEPMRLIDADALIDRIKNPYEQAQVARWVNEQPTIEPEKRTEKRTETHACDCISRQAAIEVADAVWSVTGDKNVAKVWDQIKDLPSAQQDCTECPEYDHEAHSCQTYCDVIRKTLEEAQPEPHWIPCSERLPEEYGNYLATMDDGDVQECTYSPEKNTPFMHGGWSTCEADGIVFLDIAEVTAWQPLPEPYREGGS